jgi:hypothetical protein
MPVITTRLRILKIILQTFYKIFKHKKRKIGLRNVFRESVKTLSQFFQKKFPLATGKIIPVKTGKRRINLTH